MKITENRILYIAIAVIISLHLIHAYSTHLIRIDLEITIVQHEEKIAELENINSVNIQYCEEIVQIDNKIILDISNMFTKFDKYYAQPELLILDGSVILSSTEQNIKQRNELLDELDIEYNEPIYFK